MRKLESDRIVLIGYRTPLCVCFVAGNSFITVPCRGTEIVNGLIRDKGAWPNKAA